MTSFGGSTLPACVAAVDLAWGPRRPSTIAIDGDPPIVVQGWFSDQVPSSIVQLNQGGIVLADAPLTSADGPFRKSDLALAHSGVPCLPTSKGVASGARFLAGVQKLRPDLHVYEGYPFQVYKVLAWLYMQGHRSLPPMGTYLGPQFRKFKPPSYKRSLRMAPEAVAHAIEILADFCNIRAEAVIEKIARRIRADAMDALFLLCLGRLVHSGHPWVLALGQDEPKWLVLGDLWLLEELSKLCYCQLYSDTTNGS